MRFKLTLVASEQEMVAGHGENDAAITEAHITIPDARSLNGALAEILLKLREAGYGVD